MPLRLPPASAALLTLGLLGAALPLPAQQADAAAGRRTEHVLLVTLDGLRWQDVFSGADNRMMSADHGGVKDLLATRRRFWRGEPDERRRLLMPFLWGTIVAQGQLFGDRGRDAPATIQNPHRFSYPGYSELLCGHVDPRIDSNNKFPNPNVTVLEFLAGRDGFGGRVAAFSGWDVHPFILNRERSGIFVQSGWDPPEVATTPERLELLRQDYARLPRYWEGFCWDALTFRACHEYLLARRPRVLYLALGETDEWGHGRRYDLYLQMAQVADAMLRELWDTVQSLDEYRGRTSLVVTVDHGRGRTERDWTDHGQKVDGAEEIWIAVLGPDTPALGVRQGVAVTQAQVAATVAALLGEDWCAHEPRAAVPLPGVVGAR